MDSSHNQLFINGCWKLPESGQTFVTLDPSTEEPICEVARGTAKDVDLAVSAAENALHGPWQQLSPATRGELLYCLAEIIQTNSIELARMETRDVGKPLKISLGDIDGVVATLRYNAGATDKMQGDTIPLGVDFVDFTLLEPIGVTAHIVPWNFPLGMVIRSLAPALAAGCTAVLKPSEQSPLSTLWLAELIKEAGFPDGVVNVISGYGEEAGAALVKHPRVNGVTFTGSVATGRKVSVSAAATFKSTVLELGGKNPIIIFPDADLERAANHAIEGAFENSGQVCSSISRIILHQSIKDEFIDRFQEKAMKLTIGHGLDDPDLGPLVSQEQYDKVMRHIFAAKEKGARLCFGGGRPAHLEHGYFIEPTLFDQVDPSTPLAYEETFGPVATVVKFDSEDEALSIANKLDYGLVAGLYTRDIDRALNLARRLECGSVWINGWFIGGVQAPTGGVKDSGIGRERGLAGVRNYLRIKNVGIRL
jgi:aldehyde dehydrogenase (NAD+)